jgi:hypothetical protein
MCVKVLLNSLNRLLFCKDEEALAEFRELKSAYAAFYTAQIYKRLALEERTVSPVGQVASKVKTCTHQKYREN